MRKKYKLNVYVVRKKNSESILGESAPCEDCYKKMMEIGSNYAFYYDGGTKNDWSEFLKENPDLLDL